MALLRGKMAKTMAGIKGPQYVAVQVKAECDRIRAACGVDRPGL